ncbi:TonB-dependent siderophore receptor [Halomonas urumqiensis]|uniref:TonB-dependent siderophore receptor n=1 Tax=Halomonas urumqiensis TaxID=1684789 RepID=A0A2N7UR18_9GAMM|nr:TonB-dependent siderophore receptor [Halomonas urumqiensis]PMR82875.1 TonB-dependent siderophore receptor [Halomonas urumqiensis]PTB01807.1 TonB-dependent siderophore receptor [Halomonas urumqiensis]GHE21903.1 ligand-gated channel protein [Halomonas urumqiensis]
MTRAVRAGLTLSLSGSLAFASLALAQSPEGRQLDKVIVQAQGLSSVSEGSQQYRVLRASTATGLELTPRETPQSLSVIARAQIEDFNLDTVNDVLESTPGVTVERLETDRTYYTSRGFEISNFQVDGNRVPTPYNNVHGDVDTAIYDRVEVLRGANGLSSGSGNPAATVNFIRKRPTFEPQASVSTSLGSWDRRRLEVDVAGPLDRDNRVRGRLVAVGADGDSHLDRLHRERSVLYGVIEADPSDATQLTMGHTWQRNDTDANMWGALPLYDSAGVPTDYPASTSAAPEWSYWDVETRRSFLELDQSLTDDWRLNASVTHLDMLTDTELFYISGVPDAASGQLEASQLLVSKYDRHLEQWVADIHANGELALFGRDHELVVGSDWSRTRVQQSSLYGDTPQGLPPLDLWDGRYPRSSFGAADFSIGDATAREQGVYSAAKLDLADRVTAVVGTRLSWIDNTGQQYGVSQATKRDAELTPYAGLVVDVTQDTSLYASYTEIFQPQTETDANRQFLEPIQGAAQEIGVKSEWFDGAADASLALFRIEQDNLALPGGTIPGTADVFFVPGRGIQSEGIEATLAGELADGWQASLGYTYLEIEDAEGQPAATYLPRHLVRASTSYRLPFMESLKIGARLRWQDAIERERTYADGKTRQDGYALVDLMANYAINDNLTASLNVNNVTDEKHLTSLKWDQAYFGETRSVMANLTWRY